MRKAAIITLGASAGLFVLLMLIWIGGMFAAPSSVGGFIHLALVMAIVVALGGFPIGIILLIISLTKK